MFCILRSWDILTPVLIFFGLTEENEKRDSPLVLNIKRGILAKQRRQYQQADVHFHIALKMAQDLSDRQAETYIFDVLADNFFAMESYRPSRDLYLEVLSRLSAQDGFSLGSEALVEISIKLAYCFSCLGEVDDAERGFQFAIDTQKPRTEAYWNDKAGKPIDIASGKFSNEQSNSLALLGMSYDYYSKHLQYQQNQPKLALAYRLRALDISRAINGNQHEQTLVLENDLAELYAQLEDYPRAKQHLHVAIEQGKAAGNVDLPVYYLNRAGVYYAENRADLAKVDCRRSLEFLLQQAGLFFDEKERLRLIERSKQCLNGVPQFGGQ